MTQVAYDAYAVPILCPAEGESSQKYNGRHEERARYGGSMVSVCNKGTEGGCVHDSRAHQLVKEKEA